MPPKTPKTTQLQTAFNQLAAQWEKETAFHSFMEQKANHPAHQQILAMGEAAIPFILNRIEQKGGLWYWTLETITGLPSLAGVQPLKTAPWVAVDVKEVNAAWLQWGREHATTRPSP